ncbi:MAG: hypothetical protein ACLQBA_15280 [Candidatus Binataceae bacterium]
MIAAESENGGKYVPPPDTTWQKNAPSQIILNSIFAALAAVLVAIAIPDTLDGDARVFQNWIKFAELALLIFSFLLFAISAEGTTTSCDEKDVRKYVYYMFWYNCGVISLGFALALLVGAHFVTHIASFLHRSLLLCLPVSSIEHLTIGLFIIAFGFFLWNWIRDARWLIFGDEAEFQEYLEELRDERPPVPAPTRMMKLFYRIRNR